ncbi:MAG: DNA-binding NarL/FixJ family response regulator [Sulfurimonas sp.]|jgi:DNA-binding NarL/FixJ family response regulator|uniref:response regulator transcription factor n=1 Tax=Sulfurimonas sp. TaxID=2022749 RepID=UPI0039E66F1E
MKKIILFTNMSSIQKHWSNALKSSWITMSIENFSTLTAFLDTETTPIIILFDEMSISSIHEALIKLKEYNFVTILLFNVLPEVHHASSLLGEGIKGYENSFLGKENLLKMIEKVENGHNWFFSDLTHYIINKYIKNKTSDEPSFMSLLTEKEKDIAIMITAGLSNKEIAQAEKIALSTVKGHIHHIFEKAGVTDRLSLALKFK